MMLNQLDSHTEKMNFGQYLTPYTKMSFKCTLSQNVKGKIVTFEKKKTAFLHDLGVGKDVLRLIQKTLSKGKIGKLDRIKIRNFCSSKDHCKESEKASHIQRKCLP